MTLTHDTKITRTENHAATELDNEFIVMSMGTGQILSLAETAKEIWGLLEQEQTFGSIVDHLMAEFEVSPETCKADVSAFLKTLSDQDMIRIEHA